MECYNPETWKTKFSKLDLYKRLSNNYDNVYFDRRDLFFHGENWLRPTPRVLLGQKWTSAIPFYYIEWLQETHPERIYDIGCGCNLFKNYYSNIIGVGAEDPNLDPYFAADIHDYVDDAYISGHQEYFESVFSINALHYIPLSDIRKRALDFLSMIKPNGRGWLSLNAMRMIEEDPLYSDVRIDRNKEDLLSIQNFCKEQLKNLPHLVLLDIDLLTVPNEYMDGNIHILFDKGENT